MGSSPFHGKLGKEGFDLIQSNDKCAPGTQDPSPWHAHECDTDEMLWSSWSNAAAMRAYARRGATIVAGSPAPRCARTDDPMHTHTCSLFPAAMRARMWAISNILPSLTR